MSRLSRESSIRATVSDWSKSIKHKHIQESLEATIHLVKKSQNPIFCSYLMNEQIKEFEKNTFTTLIKSVMEEAEQNYRHLLLVNLERVSRQQSYLQDLFKRDRSAYLGSLKLMEVFFKHSQRKQRQSQFFQHLKSQNRQFLAKQQSLVNTMSPVQKQELDTFRSAFDSVNRDIRDYTFRLLNPKPSRREVLIKLVNVQDKLLRDAFAKYYANSGQLIREARRRQQRFNRIYYLIPQLEEMVRRNGVLVCIQKFKQLVRYQKLKAFFGMILIKENSLRKQAFYKWAEFKRLEEEKAVPIGGQEDKEKQHKEQRND